MAEREFSDYQRSVINRYYSQMDTIMLNKLQDLAGQLYLAQTQSKKEQLWRRVEKAMANLGIPKGLAEHIMSKKDPEVLAKNIQDWLKGR